MYRRCSKEFQEERQREMQHRLKEPKEVPDYLREEGFRGLSEHTRRSFNGNIKGGRGTAREVSWKLQDEF